MFYCFTTRINSLVERCTRGMVLKRLTILNDAVLQSLLDTAHMTQSSRQIIRRRDKHEWSWVHSLGHRRPIHFTRNSRNSNSWKVSYKVVPYCWEKTSPFITLLPNPRDDTDLQYVIVDIKHNKKLKNDQIHASVQHVCVSYSTTSNQDDVEPLQGPSRDVQFTTIYPLYYLGAIHKSFNDVGCFTGLAQWFF